MKKLLLFALLLALPTYGQILAPILFGTPAAPATCTPASGYSHCRVLTIDHTQVPSTQTNFPAVAWNAFTLGASRIQNASCFDVIFTSDSTGTTKIPWEMATCNQSTGAVVAWFLVTSLSSTIDTKVYVHYDNASISTAQNTGGAAPTAVWNSNFKAVYHLGQNPGGTAPQLLDSTTNGVNLTVQTGAIGTQASPSTVAAQIGNGVYFPTATQYQGTSANSSVNSGVGTGSFTVSGWVNWNTFPTVDANANLYVFAAAAAFGIISTTNGSVIYPSNPLGAVANAFATSINPSLALSAATWYKIDLVWDGTTLTLYNNGSSVGTVGLGANVDGHIQLDGGDRHLDLKLNEVHFVNTNHSADWITTEYNNQKPSSTFLAVGAEQ